MNKLSTEKRAQILGCLVEGNSIRSTCRITGASKNTITKLLVDVGKACAEYQNKVFLISLASACNAMRFGLFAMLNKRMSPKNTKISLAMAMYGHGLLFVLTQNSYQVG